MANQDKSNLNAALGDSGDKILLLENLLNDKEGKLNELLEEVSELRDSSSWLSQELESMISLNEKLTIHAQDNIQNSNLNTSDVLDSFNQRKRSQLVEQLKQLRLKMKSRVKASEFMMLNNRRINNNGHHKTINGYSRSKQLIDGKTKRSLAGSNKQRDISSLFEELDESANGTAESSSSANRSPISDGIDDDEVYDNNDSGDEHKLHSELIMREDVAIELFSMLRKFQMVLQQRKDSYTSTAQHLYSPNSTDDSGISGDDSK